jgi:hypothetical protein
MEFSHAPGMLRPPPHHARPGERMTRADPSPPLSRRVLGGAAFMIGATAAATPRAAAPQDAAATSVTSGITYRLVGRWDADRLNRILSVDTPAFFGVPVAYAPARNAVRLYRVSYPSVVPERGNRPVTLSGLLAVPEVAATTLPLVSYQHGTVYGRQQVPSFPDQSPRRN